MRPESEEAPVERSADSSDKVRRFTSAQLFASTKEVFIEHERELYRLRCTSKGKLILTK